MATDVQKSQLLEQAAIDSSIRPIAPSNANRDARLAVLETESADYVARITVLEAV